MQIVKLGFKYRNPLIPIDLTKVFFINIHHTASEFAPPNQVHKLHLDNGWNGFGYNFIVMKDGTVYEGRGFHIGAHTANMNSKSIGVCFEGNFDKEHMSSRQLSAGIMFLRDYLIPLLPNDVEVVPHSRFNPTACPGKNFPMASLVSGLKASQLEKDMQVITSAGLVNTPGYWLMKAVKGQKVDGEFAGLLINRMADYIRKG
jgi:N-acetylmuramoyl-L-alanine amidase